MFYIAILLPLQCAQTAQLTKKTIHTARLGFEFLFWKFLCFSGCMIYLCFYVLLYPDTVVNSLHVSSLV